MANTNFWRCKKCGFHNEPHAFRQGDKANSTCEQCGADRTKEGEDE